MSVLLLFLFQIYTELRSMRLGFVSYEHSGYFYARDVRL